ncbi:hypothetical protein K466DRAFT_655402 [Polyporus arcularius HHB13444]|uniref:Uncharacterized protein n=1 Tax=Polyporus arcularius HHB13444 TaxID=1314778 RepID=A0A5C3P0E8_9APHY|nr:hypothetical protein K466DRAFT_655402 [Polyporus arcularius HHB13444]
MRFTSFFAYFCNLVTPHDSGEPLPDEPLRSLNDLIFHTRHSLPVTFDQLRSSYTDHCDDYELRGCTITRIDFCREQRKPRHAYIVAHVAGKSTSRDISCIRVDRACPCDRGENPSSLSSSVPIFAVPAGDRAKVIDAPGRGGRTSDIVFSHTFDDHGPSLLHLIATGLVLRNVDKLGVGQVEQCYLFAVAMFRILVGKDFVDAETRRLEQTPSSHANKWFGGGRTKEYSRCLALIKQEDVRGDVEAVEKQITRKLRELQVATEAKWMGEKDMGASRSRRAT